MDRFFAIGQQVLMVALVAGASAFLGASVAVNLAKSKSLENKSMYQWQKESVRWGLAILQAELARWAGQLDMIPQWIFIKPSADLQI